MATIKSKNGYREIQFFNKARKRRSYYAGKITKRDAERIANRIESIVACQIQGIAITDPDLNKWIRDLEDSAHDKLAKLEVVTARQTPKEIPTLREFADRYRLGHNGKPGTKEQLKISFNNLCDFFPLKRVNEVSQGDAEDYRRHLEKTLAENTVRRRIGRAKQLFNSAIKHRHIDSNPFADEVSTVGANEKRQVFIEQETIEHLIRSLDCESLRVIVALSRYAGCRTHETLIQRWEDVDWSGGSILIRSEKNPPVRYVPLFPELRRHLLRAKEMAPPGSTMIQNRYLPGANPCTTLKKKIISSGIKPWPKLLQNLRASRETELMAKYPAKDATAWIGNSVAVANKHYAMKLQASFAQAIIEGATPQITPQSVQNRARLTELKKGGVLENTEKDAIILDLSCLVGDQSYPARTRTLND